MENNIEQLLKEIDDESQYFDDYGAVGYYIETEHVKKIIKQYDNHNKKEILRLEEEIKYLSEVNGNLVRVNEKLKR